MINNQDMHYYGDAKTAACKSLSKCRNQINNLTVKPHSHVHNFGKLHTCTSIHSVRKPYDLMFNLQQRNRRKFVA